MLLRLQYSLFLESGKRRVLGSTQKQKTYLSISRKTANTTLKNQARQKVLLPLMLLLVRAMSLE